MRYTDRFHCVHRFHPKKVSIFSGPVMIRIFFYCVHCLSFIRIFITFDINHWHKPLESVSSWSLPRNDNPLHKCIYGKMRPNNVHHMHNYFVTQMTFLLFFFPHRMLIQLDETSSCMCYLWMKDKFRFLIRQTGDTVSKFTYQKR